MIRVTHTIQLTHAINATIKKNNAVEVPRKHDSIFIRHVKLHCTVTMYFRERFIKREKTANKC